MTLKKLYVKCPNCSAIFPSRFQAESPIQLLYLYFYCPLCKRIFDSDPQEFYEKVDEEFNSAFRKEDTFSSVPTYRVQIVGPHIFHLREDVILDSIEKAIVGNNAVIADESCSIKISTKEKGKNKES